MAEPHHMPDELEARARSLEAERLRPMARWHTTPRPIRGKFAAIDADLALAELRLAQNQRNERTV